MRTGFVTEAHVVVYCDGCGDQYRENIRGTLCFTTVNEAIAYITARGAGVGWVYDGDRLLCDGCVASAQCVEYGHSFPGPRRWRLGEKNRVAVCTVCGIREDEIGDNG